MNHIEFHSPGNLPASVRDFWNAVIRDKDPVNILTRSPEWFGMMVKKRESDAFVAVLCDQKEKPRVLLPVFAMTWPMDLKVVGVALKRKEIRIVKACGGSFVGDQLSAEDAAGLFENVLNRAGADAVWLDHIVSGSVADRLMDSISSKAGVFVHKVFRDIPHYRANLPSTKEEFRRIRAVESLKKIEGRRRAMERAVGAACRLVELRGSSEWAPYLDRIDALMNSTWQAELLGHRFSLADYGDPADCGWMRSFLLLAGEKAVAFALCYQGFGALVYERIGYDRAFARHSPGTLLLYELIDRLYECDTPMYVDYGEGEANYKNVLANNIVKVSGIMVVRKTAVLKNFFRLVSVTKTLDSLARRFAGMIGIRSGLLKKVRS